jgi:hypothetical protein
MSAGAKKRPPILGRPKAYATPDKLERAVERYFSSISREVAVTEAQDSGKRDEKGHVIYAWVPVLNDEGQEIHRREFVLPPTVTGLCRALGISRQTWCNYAADKAYAPVIERAKSVIMDWLEEQLLTRSKGVQGIMFALQNYDDWRSRTELEAGPQLLGKLDVSAMSDEQLRAMAAQEAQDEG